MLDQVHEYDLNEAPFHQFLPNWVELASNLSSSYTLNISMPSLDSRYNALKKWIPILKKGQMAHVSGGDIFRHCMVALTEKVL